jgi:hypothetical protein
MLEASVVLQPWGPYQLQVHSQTLPIMSNSP